MSEFKAAILQVATERNISVDSVIESVKSALLTAYKKDRKEAGEEISDEDIVEVDLESDSGEVRIMKNGKDDTPSGFGRIAAQTAKQVILQKIRENEKDVIIQEYKSKLGEVILAQIFRIENGVVTLDLGKSKAQGVLLQSEQVHTETYRLNQKLKVLIKDIRQTSRGTEIIVSRADPEFVKKLFEQEVPEIASGVVKIESIAREAGSRTKIAVSSSDEKIDPVGSCVGQKGVRVQAVISEIFGEKVDIINYYPVTEKYIAASLSPAKVTEVELNKEEKRATVTVPEDQQSLAIGREGQNARLANKLTGWKIDIKGTSGVTVSSDGTVSPTSGADDDSTTKVVGVWDDLIQKEEAPAEEVPADDISDAATPTGENPVDESEVSENPTTELTEDVVSEEEQPASQE